MYQSENEKIKRAKKQADLRKEFYKKNEKICWKCGSNKELNLHHIVPLSCGGSWELSNIKCLCSVCHKEYHKYYEPTKKEIAKGQTSYEHSMREFLRGYTQIEKMAYFDIMTKTSPSEFKEVNRMFLLTAKALREAQFQYTREENIEG